MNGETHYGNIHGSPAFWNGPEMARTTRGEQTFKASTFKQDDFRMSKSEESASVHR